MLEGRGLTKGASLIVFSDDWGKHPSSCQHLIKALIPWNKVLWINTISPRWPKPNFQELKKIITKFSSLLNTSMEAHDSFKVISPAVLPMTDGRLIQWINNRAIQKKVYAAGHQMGLKNPILITTIPYIVSLVGRLGEVKSIYYRVDDFSEWPGFWSDTIRRMESQLIQKVDRVVASSLELCRGMGVEICSPYLLTHGVDANHFDLSRIKQGDIHPKVSRMPHPVIGYVGLFDHRVDQELISLLAKERPEYTIVIIGPVSVDTERLNSLDNVRFIGAVPYSELPVYMAGVEVFMMPYCINTTTKSLNPLKLKEYISSGHPVVGTDLSHIKRYKEYVYIAETPTQFVELVDKAVKGGRDVLERCSRGLSRMRSECWEEKARELSKVINADRRSM